ncbi:MAG: hypothetical protein K8U57_06930 [Planctomycetes bacterium]|nr:hypothetical protein [Planctomycetota bacterium]
MTSRLAVALACAVLGSGCVSKPLNRNTVKQASTLSDLYEQQVLDNLALFCANPDAVPSFAVPAGGVVNVQNQVTGLMILQATGKSLFLDKSGPSIGGSRTVSGNWALAPINDPDKLQLMRCLFRHVVGHQADGDCDHCRESLARYFGPEWETCAAPTGWLYVGCKRDVPKNACAVGHHGDRYVWVTAEGRDALARVILSTLDIATVAFIHPPPPSKEVTTFEYRGDLLVRQEKRVVVDLIPGPRKKNLDENDLKGFKGLKPDELPAAMRSVERLNYFDPYRGLFFLPR